MLSRLFTAIVHARSKPSAIRIGWMPRSSRASLCSSRAPARTGARMMWLEAIQGKLNARHTDDTCSTIANFVILTSRELYEELRDLMFHLHLAQNSCTIICDGNFTIG